MQIAANVQISFCVATQYDEWLDSTTDVSRIRAADAAPVSPGASPAHGSNASRMTKPAHPLAELLPLGASAEVQSEFSGVWRPCHVVDHGINEDGQIGFKVHFDGFDAKWDEWLDALRDGQRVRFNGREGLGEFDQGAPVQQPRVLPRQMINSVDEHEAVDLQNEHRGVPPKHMKLITSAGPIILDLWPKSAPQTVDYITQCVTSGLYEGSSFYQSGAHCRARSSEAA
jgi:hypothetical protein